MAQQSGRLLSLDVMRGITIAGMILEITRVMEVCIYAFRACTLERPHSHRFGISVLYVHHGGLHVFLASEI